MSTPDVVSRRWAVRVLGLLVTTIALAIVLVVAFESDVQTIDPEELVARSEDARAFFIADYFFVLVYAVLSPVAIWRLGQSIAGGRAATWIKLAALLLAAAGLVDATENTLLLASTGSVSEGRVDAAHALAAPKIALFVAGAVLAVLVNVRALRLLLARSG